jgi:signal transduction histidine kinase
VVEAAPFDLREVVEHAVHDPRAAAERKGLELTAEVDPRLPATLVGDAGRLRQVLGNLLGNAVKFTEAGSVRLTASCHSRDGDTVEVLFSVADSGIGIDPAKQGLLFESFAQADPSITRRYGGTGLGLAICQELVELMGGVIELESAPGAGSTFSVRLPLGQLPEH